MTAEPAFHGKPIDVSSLRGLPVDEAETIIRGLGYRPVRIKPGQTVDLGYLSARIRIVVEDGVVLHALNPS